jgi:beta-barrel assembly-enhancing protease
MHKTAKRVISRRSFASGLAGVSLGLANSPASAQIRLDLGAISDIGRMLKNISIDEEDEIALGNDLFSPMIQATGGIYRNGPAQSSLIKFAAAIFETSARPAFSWEIVIVDNNEVNAWALPGGKIAVNKGLLRYVDNEDELAAAIAHEMGHAELSHAAKEMRKKAFYSGFSSAAQAAAVAAVNDKARAGTRAGMQALSGPMMELITSGYSRNLEIEADLHIINVFQRTGHNILRGANFYQTLLDIIPPKSKGTTSLFAGHPETEKRLALLKEHGAETPSSELGLSFEFFALKETFPTRKIYKRATK